MPIYEYLCTRCGEKNEKNQNHPLEQIICPACGQKAKRVVSIPSWTGNETAGGCAPSGFG